MSKKFTPPDAGTGQALPEDRDDNQRGDTGEGRREIEEAAGAGGEGLSDEGVEASTEPDAGEGPGELELEQAPVNVLALMLLNIVQELRPAIETIANRPEPKIVKSEHRNASLVIAIEAERRISLHAEWTRFLLGGLALVVGLVLILKFAALGWRSESLAVVSTVFAFIAGQGLRREHNTRPDGRAHE